MYGVGFVIAAVAAAWLLVRSKWAAGVATLLLLAILKITAPKPVLPSAPPDLRIAGVQLEFPSEREIPSALDKLLAAHADTQLVVLSEYTLDGPVPDLLKTWCQRTGRYLIVGGKDPAGGGNFFNTAFVIDPTGEVIFRQAKSAPIPFFSDGLPATNRAVWDSPWGKIGICVCYDLSYSRITDDLIRQGAQLLVVPTMDVIEWGAQEHTSNAHVAPVRAAEYGVPIFRLASSGISQAVTKVGRVSAKTMYPGQGEVLYSEVRLPPAGRLPLDRWLAPFSVLVVFLLLLLHLFRSFARKDSAASQV
jgi:apolipoprotein N-acyltransferase